MPKEAAQGAEETGCFDRHGRFRHRVFESQLSVKFPFDKIKIDRSFMESVEGSGNHVEMVVRSIIALGREMNMRVTVEGVETPEQAEFLTGADADQVQGFYFGRPMPAAEIGVDVPNDLRRSMSREPGDTPLRPAKASKS